MFAVYPKVASRGRLQKAVSNAPAPPIAADCPNTRSGRLTVAHIIKAATTANIATTIWLSTVAARRSAGTHERVLRLSAEANAPRNTSARAIPIEKENSPASVLRRVPPMMPWLKAMVAIFGPEPLAPLKNKKSTVAREKSSGVGRGARMPRPNA